MAAFAEAILALPSTREYKRDDLLSDPFRLHGNGPLEIYYAPFDHVNVQARVMVVGITPGWRQMQLSFQAARAALLAGSTVEEASAAAKYAASFAGAMRQNLITMLDGVGLAESLGIASAATLFDADRRLLHCTSAVRYPVFVKGRNYSGHAPDLLRSPLLTSFVAEVLAEEIVTVPSAVVFTLGECVHRAVHRLITARTLGNARCILPLPHPSPANAHRTRRYIESRSWLSEELRAWGKRSNGGAMRAN